MSFHSSNGSSPPNKTTSKGVQTKPKDIPGLQKLAYVGTENAPWNDVVAPPSVVECSSQCDLSLFSHQQVPVDVRTSLNSLFGTEFHMIPCVQPRLFEEDEYDPLEIDDEGNIIEIVPAVESDSDSDDEMYQDYSDDEYDSEDELF